MAVKPTIIQQLSSSKLNQFYLEIAVSTKFNFNIKAVIVREF